MSEREEEELVPTLRISDEEARRVLRSWEIATRMATAIKILLQAERYVKGYLKDYNIRVVSRYKENPLKLLIEVDCTPPVEEEEKIEEILNL